MDLAYALGGPGSGQPSLLVVYSPRIVIILLIVFFGILIFKKVLRRRKLKGSSDPLAALGPTCKNCNVVYTQGEKFCRKCGNLLTQ